MGLLAKRISDRRVLKMIKKWLKAGVIEDGKKVPTEKGSPQGGVISPLLANIYLHVLDTYWTKECKQLGELYRYCDDFVIICRTEQNAKTAHRIITAILNRLKLTLHPTKTKIVYVKNEGFDFLGFHFHKLKARSTGKLLPYMWPSQKALKKIRAVIRKETERSKRRLPKEEIVRTLNPIIRGWRNYFQVGHSVGRLERLDWYVSYRLMKLLQSRKMRRQEYLEKFKNWYRQSGIERFHPQVRCGA